MKIERWLAPEMIFSDGRLSTNLAAGIQAETVISLSPIKDVPQGAKIDKVNGVLCPGFIDLQVNGAGGLLFNKSPTVATQRQMRKTLHAFGTYGILPTCITDTVEVLENCAAAAIDAKREDGILGIHIEGPHISQERRGTHSAADIRPFDDTTRRILRRLRDHDIFTKITIAPEAITPNEISNLVEMGVFVAIGHTAASLDETKAAIEAGARGFTHLFNAMPPIVNRDPGPVIAALNSDAYCGLIGDGIHVNYDVLRVALRAHAHKDRMYFVSDAMPTVGGPDQFDLYDQTIHVKNDRLVNDEGSLAGAHISQRDNVQRAVQYLDVSLEDALKMAIMIPAEILGKPELGSVQNRPLGDLITSDDTFNRIKFLS